MIVFRQLTKLEVKEIADIMLKEVVVRLKEKEIKLQVTERFKEIVVDEGFDPSYGGRPLRRAIMRLLEDSMAEKMLSREIKDGDSVIVDVDGEGSVVVLNGKSGEHTNAYSDNCDQEENPGASEVANIYRSSQMSDVMDRFKILKRREADKVQETVNSLDSDSDSEPRNKTQICDHLWSDSMITIVGNSVTEMTHAANTEEPSASGDGCESPTSRQG
ncbi:unnamed protein product [Eruca vesicaria subsp. sativa]|uniref:Clp ATPase C-terminal domain-containing protein n=1 Tax=Eruca vesicaria subsp. sativa TaxID=29727 RepID=A0ABC8JBA6_ERUVS|nr:unnamed protein product [Eruca vesicaria subsp. sativa]